MRYQIEFKPRAVKDLNALPRAVRRRIMAKIEALQDDLAGDVKKLTNYSPEYRMRAGSYRVLFDLQNTTVTIYRVLHRKDAYQ